MTPRFPSLGVMMKLSTFLVAMGLSFGVSAMGFEVKNNGTCQIENVAYPAVGFGTYPLKGVPCSKAVMQAGKLGYRIIDTATFYGNLRAIGAALKPLGREKFYIISKVWPNAQTPEKIRADIKKTLEELQTTYLDAYLLHWPNSKLPIEDTLKTMEELRAKGLIRHIGVSNFTVNHLKRALEVGVTISWLQVEMHPLFYDPEVLDFCKEHGITVQAWGPLGRGRIAKDLLLEKIGKNYGKTASQVSLRWILQHGCIPLPGSASEEHMKQNRDILDFTLSEDEMNIIDARAAVGVRERVEADWNLGFTDEFDFSYDECWPK